MRDRHELEEVTGTSKQSRQTSAIGKAETQAQQHLAGIKESHRLIAYDGKPILLEIPPPPLWMEQPKLGNDISTLPVPARETEANGMSSGPVPRLLQPAQLGADWQCPRQKPRRRRGGKRERLEIRGERGPQPPSVRRKDVNATTTGRKHPPNLGVYARKFHNVLQ